MGIINDFKESNPNLSGSKDGSPSTINIAVKVESCEDKKFITGLRLDTNQQIKVYLRDVEQKGNFSRPDIPELYKKCNETGVLKFEGCYIDENGYYAARWGKVLVDDPSKTNVLVALAYVNYAKKANSNDEYVQIVTAHPNLTQNAGTLEDLNNILTKFLEAKTKGSNPFVYIKIDDGEDIEVQRVYPKMVPDGDYKKKASGAESAREFLESNYSELVKRAIQENSVKVEVIPARIVYPGNKYKDILLREGFTRNILSTVYNANKDDANQPEELGFMNTILTLRKHEDETPYIIDIAPISQQDDPILPKDL